MNKFVAGAGLTAVSLAPLSAFAAVDITGITAAFGDVTTAVAAIGVLMVGAIGAGIAYRWVVAFLAK